MQDVWHADAATARAVNLLGHLYCRACVSDDTDLCVLRVAFLQDARSTLAALRADAATAQVGSEAENLLGIMTDLLADLSGELELVGDHLITTRSDIESTQVKGGGSLNVYVWLFCLLCWL